MSDKIKCYEITPCANTSFDSVIVEAGRSWDEALLHIEDSLECQFLNEKKWDEICVTIKCVYQTRQQLDELEDE